MPHRRPHLDALAVGLMIALCAAWGLNQVTVKVANEGISPVVQASLRSAGAALLVWGWCVWRRVPLFERDGSLLPGLAAGALFATEFAALNWGLAFTTASSAVIFLYTAPFVVAVGAHLFVPGERLRAVQVGGLLAAFAGIAVAFGDALALPTRTQLIGDSLTLLAAALWGATTVLVEASRLAAIGPSKTLLYQLAGSAVVLPFIAWSLGEPGIVAPTPLVLACLAYQTVLVAFVTYLAWFWLISRYPASQLAAFSFLTPLFGLVAGGALLGERITGGLVLAMLLVGAGIYLVNRRPGATPPPLSAAGRTDAPPASRRFPPPLAGEGEKATHARSINSIL
jgi:drug/metabolite transporter (DMT)-like permease